MGIFNKKILDFSGENAFGLDIGDLTVKAVQIEREGGKDKVRSFCTMDIPPGTIDNGEILKPEVLISKIKGLCVSAKPKILKSKKAICSLPESKAFLRLIKMPIMKEGEIEEAIKWEIEANIPLTLDNVYYDWQILSSDFSKDKDKITVLILAMSKDIVDKFLDVMEKSGLEVVGLEIESTAQSRSLLNPNEKGKTNVIIDVGKHKTGFIVAYDGVPCFTSSFPISIKSLADSMAKNFNSRDEEALNLLRTEGIGNFMKKDPIFKSVESVLENLISEIEKSIDFYLTSLKYSSNIDRVIICGGGGNLKGLVPYVSKRLNQEVQIGNPWVNLNTKKEIPIINREDSLQYATAIGLALKKVNCDLSCQLK